MSNEVKKIIEEMKSVVMDFHRTAAHLDNAICNLEFELSSGNYDKDYLLLLTKYLEREREDLKLNRGYHELNQREEELWEKLVNTIITSKNES